MKKLLTLFVFFVFSSWGAMAQSGTIRGQVTDATTGEELIGVTVVIDGTTKGAPTDLNGNYNIANVEPGTYSLKVSFVSYETKLIEGVEVTAGNVTVLNVTLGESVSELNEVVVEAKVERQAEAALLTMQKRSAVVQDGISAELFSRTGDRNAASAMQRITGVSVEGGKYVYVRGLGDRYTKTTLNSAEIPGLDPERNTVQMDLFPSNLIDNIVVLKTFSPDVPGDFTGGYVNITTKDFPEKFTFQFSASLSYNDQSSLNSNFISGSVESGDALGFGRGGDRKLPSQLKDARNGTDFLGTANPFNQEMDFVKRNSFLDQNYSFSVGNQTTLFGKPLGYIATLSYRKTFDFYDDGFVGRYNVTGAGATSLTAQNQLKSIVGSDQVLWGGLLSFTLKLSERSEIGLNIIRNQSGENKAIFNSGSFADISNVARYQTRVVSYVQRSLNTFQLRGEHVFASNNMRLDWITSYTTSTQDEPDLRYFSNSIENGNYDIRPSDYTRPTRFFRDMRETTWDNKINLTIPLNSTETKLKFGTSLLLKNRDFNESSFIYLTNTTPYIYGQEPNNITPANFFSAGGVTGVRTDTQLSNSYTGEQVVSASYGMLDWRVSPKLRILTGARVEITDLTVTSDNTSRAKGKINIVDVLPAFNLTYTLKEDMNLRFAYGRTLARPTFRELAPYPTFEFVGDFILIGNNELKRTLIDNFDIRWEMFPGPGELITASLFYKTFENPIGVVIDPRAGGAGGQKNFANLPTATVYGAELEVRKNLGFITPTLQNFTGGFNFTWIRSQITIPDLERQAIAASDPTRSGETTRPLFAQSPYILNAFLNYDNLGAGWAANANFNIFGERIAEVGASGLPDVYEQPRPVLDLAVSKEFGSKRQWKLSLRGRNLLNPEFKFIQRFRGQDFIYRNYTVGREFSLGIRYLID